MNSAQDFLMLRYYTKILEACDWNEELTRECIGLIDYELSAAHKAGAKTASNMLYAVKDSLSKTYSDKIVIAMIEVLKESIESAPLLMMPKIDSNPMWEN